MSQGWTIVAELKSWSRGLDVTYAAYANVAELMFFEMLFRKSCGDQWSGCVLLP